MGNLCTRGQIDYDYSLGSSPKLDTKKINESKIKRIKENGGLSLRALCIDDSNIDLGS